MKYNKPKKRVFKSLTLRATDEDKQKIVEFFAKKPFKHNRVCKELQIPVTTIRTLKSNRPYVSYEVVQKLLTYIKQWEKL
jgi:hypothetical protein